MQIQEEMSRPMSQKTEDGRLKNLLTPKPKNGESDQNVRSNISPQISSHGVNSNSHNIRSCTSFGAF